MMGCDGEAQGNGEEMASSVQNVNIDRFEELINEEGMQLLDVRTPEEVAAGIVAGAKHINIHDNDFIERTSSELDKEKPVMVYCRSGGRSARAAQSLLDAGFGTVYNYTGGMSEWKSKGKPVESK